MFALGNPLILPYDGVEPTIDDSVLVCHGAVVLGDVHIGKDSSIWFNTVIRGDVHYIRIGERTNVQDMSMLHVTHKKYSLNIGNDVTIGHSVTLHGATLNDCCLIGMGAVVLDRATIGSHSLIAAGTVVLEKTQVPEGVLFAGVPGKVVRELRQEERDNLKVSADNYIRYVEQYRRNYGRSGA